MKKIFLVPMILAILTFGAVCHGENIIRTTLDGKFYPADQKELENEIEEYLVKANPTVIKGQLMALILPHAGFPFSGQVAANGFRKLLGKDFDTVIIVGNSHQQKFEGIGVVGEGKVRTPLGEIQIDSEMAQSLAKESPKIKLKNTIVSGENSIETQLPFLQKTLTRFKIVPILFGNSSKKDYEILAKGISKSIHDKKVLLIASSDLSHYPAYRDAKTSDEKVINAILTGDIQNFEKTIQSLERAKIPNALTFACGSDAIKTIMVVASQLGASEIRLLGYANSGDVAQDKSRVVGYAAIGFFKDKKDDLLNRAEQKTLMEIAKSSVQAVVKKEKPPAFQVTSTALNQNLGAFVTLKKEGQLRGCVGRFSPTPIPLYEVVSKMAAASATQDTRFEAVTKAELAKLKYEISVLSDLKKVNSPDEIVLGKHGVKIVNGTQSGVFLPQVATETGWNRDEFLGELCSQKAGLSRDCWKNKDTELYTFTAQVFGEE